MNNLYIGLKVNAWTVDKDLFSAFTMSGIYQCDLLMSYNVQYTTKLRHNVVYVFW
jgi:hypothetical protein